MKWFDNLKRWPAVLFVWKWKTSLRGSGVVTHAPVRLNHCHTSTLVQTGEGRFGWIGLNAGLSALSFIFLPNIWVFECFCVFRYEISIFLFLPNTVGKSELACPFNLLYTGTNDLDLFRWSQTTICNHEAHFIFQCLSTELVALTGSKPVLVGSNVSFLFQCFIYIYIKLWYKSVF